MSVFIIAEAGSSHDNDLQKAYRLIEAAKECGADAVKFQWTSRPYSMSDRRGLGRKAGDMYAQYLYKPVAWLESLKTHCDKVGIEFMCTVYLIEDIATIAPLVSRFKVSAFESQWKEFIQAHVAYDKMIIASVNPGKSVAHRVDRALYCVSKYPTALEDLHLREHVHEHDGMVYGCDGFSDHTANVLTGAAAVAAGAQIVEAHIRLNDTEPTNPDYPHSLPVHAHRGNCQNYCKEEDDFEDYVRNIRTVERML